MEFNKAILIINFKGDIGGAQKRIINFYNYLSIKNPEYYLILNKRLFDSFISKELLKTKKNVIVLDFDEIGKTRLNLPSPIARSSITSQNKEEKTKYVKLTQFISYCKFIKNRWLPFCKEIRTVVKVYNIKLVYAVWMGGIMYWPINRILKTKMVYGYNDSSLSSISKNFFEMFFSEYWVLKQADKIDFLSEGIINDLEKNNITIPKNKINITPNSFIDFSNYFSDLKKEHSVVFLSRMVSIKNPILFLEAVLLFNKTYDNYLNVKFYMIGDGPLRNEINEFLIGNKIPNVIFEESNYTPWEYLRKSKVFISIQKDNNYPSQSVIEAMACENAIIASNVGETHKLVSENEGILVNLESEEICNAIIKLLSEENYRTELGKNAREKVLSTQTIESFYNYFIDITQYQKS